MSKKYAMMDEMQIRKKSLPEIVTTQFHFESGRGLVQGVGLIWYFDMQLHDENKETRIL